MFEIKDLSFYYNGTKILNGLNLEIETGAFFGIIGPNGAGKTTLIKLLDRLLRPSAGEIWFEKKPLQSYGRKELSTRIAVVPQDETIQFPFTVFEIILMGRFPYRKGLGFVRNEDIDLCTQVMRRTNLLPLAHKMIAELSGGEKQRMLMARALVQNPEVLILDEANAHLDIFNQIEIFELAEQTNQENGKTVIAVTHDINLAAQFCDRMMIIDKGRIHAIGTPEEIVTEEIVREVFGKEVSIGRLPESGKPFLTLRRSNRQVAAGQQTESGTN